MRETIKLTTAQALVKFLNQQYIEVDGEEKPFVEGVFAIFGHGNVLGIGQALEENPGHLKVFQGKNEQGMSHVATAFSRQKLRQQIFAVSASSGPGSANMLTAVATAFVNNIPVLFLPADTFATRQPDPALQQLEVESSAAITTNDAFKPISRYWDRVERPEQLMTSLIRAFEVMTNPATAGPATICLPQDTGSEAFDFDSIFFEKRIHYLNRQVPTERELQGATALIKQSKKPVLMIGGGAKYSDTSQELMVISKKHGIPLVETHAGKSTIVSDFEYNMGGTGVLGTSAANQIIEQADLIIGIGTRYTDFTTSSKTAFHFKQTKFLNINVSRMQTYKFDGFQVVGDAKITLQKLLPLLTGYTSEFIGTDTVSLLKEKWQKERRRLHGVRFSRESFIPEIEGHFTQTDLNDYSDALNTDLVQTDVLLTINEEIAENSIVVSAAGSIPGDMQRLWEAKVANTYHLEYGYSCMGYEISGALGAKIASPNQEVYAMIGDGSFLMLHSDLITSLQYGYKINVMLFDNAGFGSINNLQMENGSNSYQCEFRDFENNIVTIDYAKVAEGYGAKVYRVNNRMELIAAIKDAKTQKGSTLIDIKILPKTMTHGYGGWWNIGVSEVSEMDTVKKAFQEKKKKLKNAWKY